MMKREGQRRIQITQLGRLHQAAMVGAIVANIKAGRVKKKLRSVSKSDQVRYGWFTPIEGDAVALHKEPRGL